MELLNTEIESSFEAVDMLVRTAIRLLEEEVKELSQSQLFNINFMLREILNNAVEHGNHFENEKKVMCHIEYEAHQLTFRVRDEGKGIHLEDIPLMHEPKDLLRQRNRGHETIREMAFEVYIDQTEVTVILKI